MIKQQHISHPTSHNIQPSSSQQQNNNINNNTNQINYIPSKYTINLNNYTRSQMPNIVSYLSAISKTSPHGVHYPVFKLLKAITKLFMLNQIQTIFLAFMIKQTRWNILQKIIVSNSESVRDIVCVASQDVQYKCLILYLMVCSFTVKYFLNEQQEVNQVMDQALRVCPNFKTVFEFWAKKHNSITSKISPRVLNRVYKQLYQKSRIQQEDFNRMVDAIIHISPAYNPEKGRAKVNVNNIKKQQDYLQLMTPIKNLSKNNKGKSAFGNNNNSTSTSNKNNSKDSNKKQSTVVSIINNNNNKNQSSSSMSLYQNFTHHNNSNHNNNNQKYFENKKQSFQTSNSTMNMNNEFILKNPLFSSSGIFSLLNAQGQGERSPFPNNSNNNIIQNQNQTLSGFNVFPNLNLSLSSNLNTNNIRNVGFVNPHIPIVSTISVTPQPQTGSNQTGFSSHLQSMFADNVNNSFINQMLRGNRAHKQSINSLLNSSFNGFPQNFSIKDDDQQCQDLMIGLQDGQSQQNIYIDHGEVNNGNHNINDLPSHTHNNNSGFRNIKKVGYQNEQKI